MGFLRRLFGGNDKVEPADGREEHAVILHFKLAGETPTTEEAARYRALREELARAIVGDAAGQMGGDEWSGGECVMHACGRDAERLWDAIMPVLEERPFPRGSYAIKRFGGPESSEIERVRIEWDG
jgi:hypothetical protein